MPKSTPSLGFGLVELDVDLSCEFAAYPTWRRSYSTARSGHQSTHSRHVTSRVGRNYHMTNNLCRANGAMQHNCPKFKPERISIIFRTSMIGRINDRSRFSDLGSTWESFTKLKVNFLMLVALWSGSSNWLGGRYPDGGWFSDPVYMKAYLTWSLHDLAKHTSCISRPVISNPTDMLLRIGVFKYIYISQNQEYLHGKSLQKLQQVMVSMFWSIVRSYNGCILVSQSRYSWPLPATYERASSVIGYNVPTLHLVNFHSLSLVAT